MCSKWGVWPICLVSLKSSGTTGARCAIPWKKDDAFVRKLEQDLRLMFFLKKHDYFEVMLDIDKGLLKGMGKKESNAFEFKMELERVFRIQF